MFERFAGCLLSGLLLFTGLQVPARAAEALDPLAVGALAAIPGLGHLQLGRTVEGFGVLGAWLATRSLAEQRLPPVFYPGLPAQATSLFALSNAALYRMQIYDAYQEGRMRTGDRDFPVALRARSPLELIQAPFQPDQLLDGGVWALPAVLLLSQTTRLVETAGAGKNALQAKRVEAGKVTLSAPEAYIAQVLAGLAIALHAGVSEEALYRGVLQTELERRIGFWPALTLASAAFGVAHVGGINVDLTPWGQFIAPALLGAGFGYLYHVSGNDLAKPIAAHVYWDAIVIATRGLEAHTSPLDNPLGFTYRF